MAWRVAKSLARLRDQLNAAYPNRSKASDGTIGDAAHAATVSDHNPDQYGIVRAFDITHDPAHGVDGTRLAAALAKSRDPRIKYLIWNGRMLRAYEKPGIPAWTWSAYTGTDPHTNHVHLSVVADSRADDTRPWQITIPPTAKDWFAMATTADLRAAVKAELNDPDFLRNVARYVLTGLPTGPAGQQLVLAGHLSQIKAMAAENLTPEQVQKALAEALSAKYDATVTITPKES
jgi:hypothetical protein